MNTHLLASAFGRWLAPVLLAATVVAGSLGFSSVASAQERGRGAGPHAFVHGSGRFAPGPYVGPDRHGYVPAGAVPASAGAHGVPGGADGASTAAGSTAVDVAAGFTVAGMAAERALSRT